MHLVNNHKLPIICNANILVVKQINPVQQDDLRNILPYIPWTVGDMEEVEIKHPNRAFEGFYILQWYNTLCHKAKNNYKGVNHSGRLTPVEQSMRRKEWKEKDKARKAEGKTEEELEEEHQEELRQWRDRYQKKRATMTEEEKEVEQLKGNKRAREWSAKKRQTNKEYRRKKKETDKRYNDKKKDNKDFMRKKCEYNREWAQRRREDPELRALGNQRSREYQRKKRTEQQQAQLSSSHQTLDS